MLAGIIPVSMAMITLAIDARAAKKKKIICGLGTECLCVLLTETQKVNVSDLIVPSFISPYLYILLNLATYALSQVDEPQSQNKSLTYLLEHRN